MATRRERLENKLARREEWADKAKARSDSHFDTAHKMRGSTGAVGPGAADGTNYRKRWRTC